MPDPTSLALADLEPLAVLGRGAKGVVFLVRTGDGYYAFKAISRDAGGGGTHRRVWSERDVLQTLHHPLLPTLHGVAETERIVGFAMDQCSGGDLNALRHRQTEHMFTTDVIRFYAAELVLAISHLHHHNIVYRDLKPENVLIQSTGHLMLVDFDLSIRLPEGAAVAAPPPPPPPRARRRLLSCFSRDSGVSPEDASVSSGCSSGAQLAKSNSFVGTEEYVAPEVIKGDGHDYSVDWWGLGVVLYEMLYGRTPFRGQNRKETFYRILSKEPELVGEPTSLRNLISRLLEKDPGLRITGAEIKSHEFFEGVDWEAVTEVGRPPFIPAEVEMEQIEGKEAIDIEKVVHDIFGAKAKEGNWQEQVKTVSGFYSHWQLTRQPDYPNQYHSHYGVVLWCEEMI